MSDVPGWRLLGFFFDACNCEVPCPCAFARTPTYGNCDGVLAWHINEGHYGDTRLDGLNLVGVGGFEGKSWSGNKITMGLFMEERTDNAQREALNMIFGGRAGGWPTQLAAAIGELRGVEFVPIDLAIDDDLAGWRVQVPGRIDAQAQPLTGPTTLPGRRVQMVNSPGCETGPEGVVTWGESMHSRADAFGFSFEYQGRSSRIITFDWSGPDS